MDPLKSLKRLNVYDFTIASLLVIAAIGIFYGNGSALLQVIAAPIAAGILDYLFNILSKNKGKFPKSAIITGLIVAMVISPGSALTAVAAAIMAVLSKHVIRYSKGGVFNPAALGLVLSALIFHSSDSWWAAGVSFSQPATFIAIILALLASWKLNKLILSASFLLSSAILTVIFFGLSTFANPQGMLGVIGFCFFAGLMLTEPKTSAVTNLAMAAEGFIVLLLSMVFLIAAPALASASDGLLLSLLAVNLMVPLLNRTLK